MFTIVPLCAIIIKMKKVIVAVACAALLPVATAGITTQYALAAGETVYPQFISELEIGNITAYAYDGTDFAFVGDSNERELYVYSGGRLDSEGNKYVGGELLSSSDGLCALSHSTEITDVWYEGDTLTFTDANKKSFSFIDGVLTETEATYSPPSTITIGDIIVYATDTGNIIFRYPKTDELLGQLDDGEYSMLNYLGGRLFALKEGKLCAISAEITGGNGAPVQLEGLAALPLAFEYTDRSHELTIAVGDSLSKLRAVKDEAAFVTVAAGQYITEIDTDGTAGEYFAIGKGGTTLNDQSKTALLLATSGNADILAIGEKTYITVHNEVTSVPTEYPAPFATGQLNYAAGVYSSPYMCKATELETLAQGAKVQILYELKSAVNSALAADFCRVKYTAEDGTEAEGYVATGFITAYDFSAENGDYGETTPPENYSEDNVAVTVILVLAIVVIVIAGVAFLAHTSGADKRRKKQADGGEDARTDDKKQ